MRDGSEAAPWVEMCQMLYKLSKTRNIFNALKPMPFKTLADYGQVEKDLENLLADNMLEVLFEGRKLMPIFQERVQQPEADIYALDEHGNLVIFELKRAVAGGETVYQILRYCEVAAQWDYSKLQGMYEKWTVKASESNDGAVVDLQADHQVNFNLESPLLHSEFNQQQKLMVVGSAGNQELIDRIDYWRSKGIDVDFVPYRVYDIGPDQYFEFFSPPYDVHANPGEKKGVLFDTNRTYRDDSIWYMCKNDRVAAFGTQKHIVNRLGKGDIVFLYHKGKGIVAAGCVKGGVHKDPNKDAWYRNLEWLTRTPTQRKLRAMSADQIQQILDRKFFWASTIKRPCLSVEQSGILLEALKDHIGSP